MSCPDGYRPLISVDGKTVGFVCLVCGRLNTVPHREDCAVASDKAKGESWKRMILKEFADRLNRLTPEQIAEAMESLPTDALEWAVNFEALSHPPERAAPDGRPSVGARGNPPCKPL